MIIILFLTSSILVSYIFFQDATRSIINRFLTPNFNTCQVAERKKRKNSSKASSEEGNVINISENTPNTSDQMKVKRKSNSKSPSSNSFQGPTPSNGEDLDKTQNSISSNSLLDNTQGSIMNVN